MSFWSQTSDPNRRFRTNPRSSSFFARESSPDTEMFFESPSGFTTFPRANLSERLGGSSVFEDFPRRPLHHPFSDQAFGSLHRRQHPKWSSSDGSGGSRESSPTLEGRGGAGSGSGFPRHAFFQRADSIPVRVSHESRQGSRSSTPESSSSAHSHASSGHSRPQSNSAEANPSENGSPVEANCKDGSAPFEGSEEHAGVASKTARSSFTAKRLPKVHHIPILVESRDGAQTVVVTPPAAESPNTNPPSFRAAANTASKPAAYPMPNVPRMGTPPNVPRTATPPNVTRMTTPPNVPRMATPPTVQNESEAEETPIMADPNKPIPAVAPESMRYNNEVPSSAEHTNTNTNNNNNKSSAPKNKFFDAIARVSEDVEKYKEGIAKFNGVRGDKQYVYLDEMFTRCLITLDNIFVEGNDELRAARRAVVVTVNNCIKALEQKVNSQVANGEQSTAAVAPRDQSAEQSCSEPIVQEPTTANDTKAKETCSSSNVAIEEIQPESTQVVVIQDGKNDDEMGEIVEVTV